MTVEQFLEEQFKVILKVAEREVETSFGTSCLSMTLSTSQDFKAHTATLISNLRSEYAEGVRSIKDMMSETTQSKLPIFHNLIPSNRPCSHNLIHNRESILRHS